MLINENVKAKYLEAEISFEIFRLSASVHMSYRLVARDDSFYSEFFYLLPTLGSRNNLWVLFCSFVDVVKDWGQRPLVTLIIVAFILLEVFGVLVDGIIGKVHKKIT